MSIFYRLDAAILPAFIDTINFTAKVEGNSLVYDRRLTLVYFQNIEEDRLVTNFSQLFTKDAHSDDPCNSNSYFQAPPYIYDRFIPSFGDYFIMIRLDQVLAR